MTNHSAVEMILAQAHDIKHHGVKGMRWGFHKKPGGGYRKEGRVRGSEDHERTQQLRRMHISQLSNDELRAVNTRLQLETTFRQVNPSVFTRGQRRVNQVLQVAATVQKADQFYQSPTGQRLSRAILSQTTKK